MSTHLIAILVLLFLSAMFSATETAFTSLSLIQHRTLQNKRSRSSRMAYALSQKNDVLLTTVLVGNNVVNISASALVTTYAIEFFSNRAVGYATGLLTLVILIFGEIAPKQIAMS
ncbi:MAG TPA: CNNM domain-containing protein, partial [Sphaerochaeta sp.]|nr:CNNM domain-containing protein [Sphaerochaeta sp.]